MQVLGFTVGKPNILHIAGFGTARGVQRYYNHIHSMKYLEVIYASCAASSAETDYIIQQ